MAKISTEKSTKPAKRKRVSSTERIFGSDVLKHGYTGVPNIMVRGQAKLGLNPTQINILIQLLSYYFDPDRPPYPPKRDLLKRMRISESTLKKHIKELEEAGFIKREQQVTPAGEYGSNIYHLDGLMKKLKKLVPEFDEEQKEHRESRVKTETPNARRSPKSTIKETS